MLRGFSIPEVLKSKKAAGVEVVYSTDGKHAFNLTVLKKEKSSLDIEAQHLDLPAVHELPGLINTNIPVCLVVNGKGIISKKVSIGEQENERTLLSKVLPNAEAEDFYLQSYPVDDQNALISVARKSVVDELADELKEMGYHMVNIFIGPFSMSGVINLISSNDAPELKVGHHLFELSNGGLTGYRQADEPSWQRFSIDGETATAEIIPAFAAAFQYFVPLTIEPVSNITGVDEAQKEYRQRRIFQLAGVALLALLFGSLLINFFIFDHYRGKFQELDGLVSRNKDQLTMIKSLEADLTMKKAFLERAGVLKASRTSFYADRIAMTVPANIKLTEMSINPLQKKTVKGEKKISFADNAINISGLAKKSTLLNDWIKELKTNDWVNTVTIVNYTQESAVESGIFELSIGIE